jgi:hypothetical protein
LESAGTAAIVGVEAVKTAPPAAGAYTGNVPTFSQEAPRTMMLAATKSSLNIFFMIFFLLVY